MWINGRGELYAGALKIDRAFVISDRCKAQSPRCATSAERAIGRLYRAPGPPLPTAGVYDEGSRILAVATCN